MDPRFAAKPKRPDLESLPTHARMSEGQPIRRNPSTDQKKARQRIRRSAAEAPEELRLRQLMDAGMSREQALEWIRTQKSARGTSTMGHQSAIERSIRHHLGVEEGQDWFEESGSNEDSSQSGYAQSGLPDKDLDHSDNEPANKWDLPEVKDNGRSGPMQNVEPKGSGMGSTSALEAEAWKNPFRPHSSEDEGDPDQGRENFRQKREREDKDAEELHKAFSKLEGATMHTESALLQAMASATSLEEQQHYAAELEQVRARKSAEFQAERELVFGASLVEPMLTPVRTHEMHTIATDWVASEDTSVDVQAMHQAMGTEANLWFQSTSPELRADTEEFGIQAAGMGQRVASQYAMAADAALESFLGQVDHLYRATTGKVTTIAKQAATERAEALRFEGSLTNLLPFVGHVVTVAYETLDFGDGQSTGNFVGTYTAEVDRSGKVKFLSKAASGAPIDLYVFPQEIVRIADGGMADLKDWGPDEVQYDTTPWSEQMSTGDQGGESSGVGSNDDERPGPTLPPNPMTSMRTQADVDNGQAHPDGPAYYDGIQPETFDVSIFDEEVTPGDANTSSDCAPAMQEMEGGDRSVQGSRLPFVADRDRTTDPNGGNGDGSTVQVFQHAADCPGGCHGAGLVEAMSPVTGATVAIACPATISAINEANHAHAPADAMSQGQWIPGLMNSTLGSQHTAEDAKVDTEQSGQAGSSLPNKDVNNPSDKVAWPWEIEENGGGSVGDDTASGKGASDVANVPTPGGPSGYPQPKKSGLDLSPLVPYFAAWGQAAPKTVGDVVAVLNGEMNSMSRTAAGQANMTRQHFEHIADSISTAPVDAETRKKLAEHFADRLSSTNAQFKRDVFVNRASSDPSKRSSLVTAGGDYADEAQAAQDKEDEERASGSKPHPFRDFLNINGAHTAAPVPQNPAQPNPAQGDASTPQGVAPAANAPAPAAPQQQAAVDPSQVQAGSQVMVFDASGQQWNATVQSSDGTNVTYTIDGDATNTPYTLPIATAVASVVSAGAAPPAAGQPDQGAQPPADDAAPPADGDAAPKDDAPPSDKKDDGSDKKDGDDKDKPPWLDKKKQSAFRANVQATLAGARR